MSFHGNLMYRVEKCILYLGLFRQSSVYRNVPGHGFQDYGPGHGALTGVSEL